MLAGHLFRTMIAAVAIANLTAQDRYERRSVRDYGATGDGVTDDYAALQAALDDAAYHCVVFPKGIYRHSRFLNLKASHSCVVGEAGAVLSNSHPGTSGYSNDGIRVGDASPRDDGDGRGINIEDVSISGLEFDGEGRVGVWVVYARNVTVENIAGAGQAVVAVGNDADDDCEDITVRDIRRTGPTASNWYTVGIFSTRRFTVERVESLHPVGAQALAVTNSQWGMVRQVTIDQRDGLHDGIALLDSKHVRLSDFHVRRARKGVVIFSSFQSPDDADQYNVVGPGRVTDSQYAVHIYSRHNTVQGLASEGSAVGAILLGTDARDNQLP